MLVGLSAMSLLLDVERHGHGYRRGPSGTDDDTAGVCPDGQGASRYTDRHHGIACTGGLTQQR